MAYSNVLYDDFTAVSPPRKPGMHRITAGFNVALLAFQAVTGFVTFLASDRARAFPLAGILLTSFIDLIRLIVVMMLIAWFVREFWQRLITSLVPIRPIDFQEALAIVLMFGLLLGR